MQIWLRDCLENVEAIESPPERVQLFTTAPILSPLSESQSAPVPIPGDVQPEGRAAVPDADDECLSGLADKNLVLTYAVPPILSREEGSAPAPPRPASPHLDPQHSLDNPDVDPISTQADANHIHVKGPLCAGFG